MVSKIIAGILFFLVLTFSSNVKAQQSDLDIIKKTTVFIGEYNSKKEPVYHATGFLVSIKNIFHLVTAKHVIMEMIDDKFTGKLLDDNYQVFFNSKDGKLLSRSLNEIKNQYKVNWIYDSNPNIDLAMIPFAIDTLHDDLRVIPDNFFLSSNKIYEVYDVFFVSFQPGLQSRNKINPIIRIGAVSLKNEDKSFFIDAFAFPGNSGSPVFLKPSFIRSDNPGTVNLGGDPYANKFIGVIGEYLPYQEVAISVQTQRPRVVFEENTGLSKVWSVEYINNIISSSSFQIQLNRLLQIK